MRVIIAGGRDYKDYSTLKSRCEEILEGQKQVTILSGGQRGADTLGEIYGETKGYKVIKYEADWKRHGKAAGPIRNREMAAQADLLIAFFNGQSPGTQSMINEARRKNLKIRIIKY